jgi:hypothetical protein
MRRYLTIGLVMAAFGLPAHAQVVNPYAPQYYRSGPGRAYQRVPSPVNPYQGGRGYYYYQPAPQPRAYQGYYPGMRVQPPVEQEPGLSLRRLFGYEDERRRAAPRAVPRIKPKPAAPVVAKQEKPKVDPSAHVVVFGDALADLTGQGLDDAFSDSSDVAVVRKARTDISLAREGAEWPKIIQEVLNGGQKITVAVVMLGSNERQSIMEGEVTHEPVSERWKQLYRDRVDAVVRTFQERGIPVVWIGVPPMRNAKLTADYVAMNEIYRESVERLGGSYVDIWPGFVDDENHYTPIGPDVDGQLSRLRTNDGVLFTRAGARKAAHFADAEIKRLIEAKRTGTAVAATPAPGAPVEGGAADQIINAAVPPAADPRGTPPGPAPKPVAGPVLPLTAKPDVSPGGTLISGRPRVDGDAAHHLQKTLREGVAPGPRPGRADDFRWPRS